VKTAEWEIYHGDLWTEIWRDLWEEVLRDGAEDYCAVFMLITIEEEVRGGVKGLRVLVCEREWKHRLWVRS
jgi:hypothetical protein